MILNKIGYGYDDITAIPVDISGIDSRTQCKAYRDSFLPIFTAPMASVVNEENIDEFLNNGIIPILPRNINFEIRKINMNEQTWVALSLKEFEDLFITNAKEREDDFRTHYFICIDIANGHMESLYHKCNKAKILAQNYNYKLTIMTGNIANPETYRWICDNAVYYDKETKKAKCSVDYIRLGIGGGKGCITTSNVSIHYPQATLIDETYKIKKELQFAKESKSVEGLPGLITVNKYDFELPKIVADGGIRNFDHVNIALGLGADYVMIGSLFAQCIESAGEKTNKNTNQKTPLRFPIERYKNFSVDAKGNWSAYYTDEAIEKLLKPWKDSVEIHKKELEENLYPHAKENYEYSIREYNKKNEELKEQKILGSIDVKFFGMASADGQKAISGKKTKTAEGITKYLPVIYTLKGWCKNMAGYLASAMSYTDCHTLNDYIGNIDFIINSTSEIKAVNK